MINYILDLSPESDYGFILEVDLDYPDHLHDLHNDYPLAPEKITDDKNMSKLIPNLNSKMNYVCHYRNLQFYVRHGLSITKVHSVLRFRQKKFLADYINKNTILRQQAKTTFEKDYFKLLNNSCFGKTMENPYKRKDVRLVTTPYQAIKLTSKPEYKGYKEFHDSLYAVTMKKKAVNLDKPVFIGMTVLDLSKLLMMEFYYDYFKVKYPECKVLYTDTDSLIMCVQTEDVYKDLETELQHYDTSDYPKDHKLFSEINKKVIGKMKDEMNGTLIEEYVGLRSKMYSIKHQAGVISKAKGVQRSAIKNKVIRHEHYLQTLDGQNPETYPNMNIRSRNHVLETTVTNKKTLATGDTKHVFQTKEISFAPGHYKLRSVKCGDTVSNGTI